MQKQRQQHKLPHTIGRHYARRRPQPPGATMKTYQFAGLDKPVSAIGIGTRDFHPDNRRHDFAMLDAFVAGGGTYLDTAEVYRIAEDRGCAESVIGQWISARPGVREKVVLASKGLIPGYYGKPYRDNVVITPEAVHHSISDSLARLHTDYLDVWMFHRDSPELPVGPLVDAMDDEIRRGRVRTYGASNWSSERLQQALDYARATGKRKITFTSPLFGLAKPNEPYSPGTISVADNDKDWFVQKHFPVVAWASLGSGFFMSDTPQENPESDMARVFYSEDNLARKKRAEQLAAKKRRSVVEIVLGYVISQEFSAIALSGAQTLQEVEDTICAGDVQLNRAECNWLDLTCDRKPF